METEAEGLKQKGAYPRNCRKKFVAGTPNNVEVVHIASIMSELQDTLHVIIQTRQINITEKLRRKITYR